jgi:hypothetical protein
MAVPVEPVGRNLHGSINTPNTFSLTGFRLQAGVTYAFLAAGRTEGGGTLPNPDMAVFDTNAAGQPVHALAYNDNSFLSVDPLIQFTPKISGEYIVAVGGRGGVGSFSLEVTPAGPPIGSNLGFIGV